MSELDKYQRKYESLEASIKDVPSRPRVGTMKFFFYSAVIGVCVWKDAHWAFFVGYTLVYLYINYDVGKRFNKKPRDRPD